MDYPIYRKYSNGKSFFKILSETSFEERKLTGRRAEVYLFNAKIFPDRQLIQDMIEMKDGFWEPSSEAEFTALIADS